MDARAPDRGKPAEYGQEIVKRRFRLTAARLDLKNRIMLDFGCGNGAQTAEFFGSGCKIVAVDVDVHDLRVLAHHSTDRGSLLPVHYDGLHLPILSESVDTVVSYDVMEHVADESQSLREIHRVLKPGGSFVLSVPNKRWIFETHGARLPLLPWNRVPFFSWLPRPIHRRFAKARIYSKRDIMNLLREHSFEICEVQYITAPLDVLHNQTAKRLLRSTIFRGDTNAWGILSTSIFVHSRKTTSTT